MRIRKKPFSRVNTVNELRKISIFAAGGGGGGGGEAEVTVCATKLIPTLI